MSECYNCVPIDKEHAKRIACFSNIYKKIRDRGYTESQIEQDVHFINQHIQLAAQKRKTNTFGKCFFVEQGENLHCEPELKICVRFSLCMGSSVNLMLSKIHSELSGNQNINFKDYA